jgi:hypothetical protein
MASPFGKEQTHNGSFRAEDLTMTFGGAGGPGALVQQVNFTLTRQINTLYEIGSSNVYYVGNRRQGQAQLSRIVGGTANFKTLVNDYGDMCTPKDVVLTAAGGCGGTSGSVTYTLKKATLTQLGASVTAQDVVITENLGFMFLDIDYA